jgi:hypothetical protein
MSASQRILLITIFILAFATVTSAQVDAGAAAAVARPLDEATISDSIPLYKIKSSNFQDLEKLKTPDVQFLFADETKRLTDLSPTVRDILDRHWKKALKFFYDEHFSRPLSPQDAYDRNIDWLKTCNRTHNELVRTEIAAPQGKRAISYSEAEKTFGFINRVAKVVVERAKKVKPELVSHRF